MGFLGNLFVAVSLIDAPPYSEDPSALSRVEGMSRAGN